MEFQLPFGDPVAINKSSGAESREPEGAVRVHAERLLYHCVEPREILERVAVHIAVIGEAGSDLLPELVQFGWVGEQIVDTRGE